MGLQYCAIELFSSGILVILILMGGIVSGIIQPCGMQFFILLAKGDPVKEDPSRYCGTVHLASPV